MDQAKNDVTPLESTTASLVPSRAQQSWGALASIIIIVLMVVVGAFYAWGKRIAENGRYEAAAGAGETASSTGS